MRFTMMRVGNYSLLYSVLFLLALVSSSKAEVFTSIDGHKFEVNLNLQKDSIMLGEPIYMDFEVKNLSNVDLGILYGGDYRNEFARPDNFNINVFDENGQIIPKPKTMTMGGMIGFQKCLGGGSHNIRLYLPHWGTFERTGRYRIEVKKKLVVKGYELTPISATDLQEGSGIPVNLFAQLKVVPADYRKMGTIIDAIGKRVVDRDDTSERLVPFINDARIIKYLALAIRKNQWLIRHLAKFNDDQALDAILSRISDQDREVRRNVSVSLSKSIHPNSKTHLLQMRNDEYFAIRLDVVHYLGKVRTKDSTKILKKMMNDENKDWVGNEAKRYLRERGEKVDGYEN